MYVIRGMPLGGRSQDGGVTKGEVPQKRGTDRTGTALLDDRWAVLCTSVPKIATKSSGKRLCLAAGRQRGHVARDAALPGVDPLAVLETGQVARDHCAA